LCNGFQLNCVLWWPWHDLAIWWLLFQACIIKSMLICHFIQQGESQVTLCINKIYSDTHKCITWPKKSSKGKQAWDKVCMDSSMILHKLNMPIITKYVSNL
jgi:hypothetical protein